MRTTMQAWAAGSSWGSSTAAPEGILVPAFDKHAFKRSNQRVLKQAGRPGVARATAGRDTNNKNKKHTTQQKTQHNSA